MPPCESALEVLIPEGVPEVVVKLPPHWVYFSCFLHGDNIHIKKDKQRIPHVPIEQLKLFKEE